MVRVGRLREHRGCQSDSRDKGKLQWVVCVRAPWEEGIDRSSAGQDCGGDLQSISKHAANHAFHVRSKVDTGQMSCDREYLRLSPDDMTLCSGHRMDAWRSRASDGARSDQGEMSGSSDVGVACFVGVY